MLVESDEPLREIAVGAGFAHQSHFTRVFKEATGVTPAEFRRLRTRWSVSATGRESGRLGIYARTESRASEFRACAQRWDPRKRIPLAADKLR